MMKEQYIERTRQIRETASFRIEALESALIETKFKGQKEVDRIQMRMSEMESSMLNQLRSDKELNDDLRFAEQLVNGGMHEMDLTNGKTIDRIVNVIKAMKKSVGALKYEKEFLQKSLGDVEAQLSQLTIDSAAQCTMLDETFKVLAKKQHIIH